MLQLIFPSALSSHRLFPLPVFSPPFPSAYLLTAFSLCLSSHRLFPLPIFLHHFFYHPYIHSTPFILSSHSSFTIHNLPLTCPSPPPFLSTGCSLSILCLILSLLCFTLIRTLKSLRNTVHINLCVNLGAAQLIFILTAGREVFPDHENSDVSTDAVAVF